MTTLPQLDGPAVPPLSGGKPRQLIILLHGYGSNGDDLIGLVPAWQSAFPDALFVSPNAPERVDQTANGFQWWALRTLSLEERAAGARQAGPVMDAFIDQQLERHGLTEDKLALVGFSQGTMMALHVGPRRERQVAGILGFSGMLTDPRGLAAEMKTRPPVCLIHGDRDPVLPIGPAYHYSVGALEALDFELEAHVRPGLQHGIDPGAMQLGLAFLKRVLAD